MRHFLQSLRGRQLRRFDFDRASVLARAVALLADHRAPPARSSLWTDAIYGWDNAQWSADEPYLAEVVRSAERSTGSILECGSGLTTLLMGAVAQRRGIALHSLEHNALWHSRVREALHAFGASTTILHLAPLIDHGPFDWYDAPRDRMPDDFTLVVCDGPPDSTRGGRTGMMSTMRDKLASGCAILLDDANRPAERELVRSWSAPSTHATVDNTGRGFARIVFER